MTTGNRSLLGHAWRLLSARFVVAQLGLALLVSLLGVLWLRMPDASVLEVAASVVLALLTCAVAGAGQAAIILHLCRRPLTRGALVRGALLVIGGIVLWFLWSTLLARVRANDFTQITGYLNSRLPRGLRYYATFNHLLLWIGWLCTALSWMGGGLLALVAVSGTAALRPGPTILRALRSLSWWAVLLIGGMGVTAFTGLLIHWTPGHGLASELVSAALRLSVSILLELFAACLLIALTAACVIETNPAYGIAEAIPEGTPLDSHSRTEDIP